MPVVVVSAAALPDLLLALTGGQIGGLDAQQPGQVEEDEATQAHGHLRLRVPVVEVQHDDRHTDGQRAQGHRRHQVDNYNVQQATEKVKPKAKVNA